MPTFANFTAVRDAAEGFSLALTARHIFVAGEPSDEVTTVKGRVPDNVDVLLGSNLVFSLRGTLGRTRLTGSDMQQSAVARHLLQYLKAVCITRAHGRAAILIIAWPELYSIGPGIYI